MSTYALPHRGGLVLALLAAIGCDTGGPTRPAELPVSGVPVHVGPPAVGVFPVGPELAAVRRATSRFHALETAQAAGYSIENEPCVSSPAGGMGIHAPNLALILDPALDPSRPELLLYEPQANGGYRLVGVEYFQAVLLRNTQTQAVDVRLDPEPWDPAGYEIVNPQPELFGQRFHLSPPPAPHVPWHWALHVWVWAHNSNGMFADWNPAVRCS